MDRVPPLLLAAALLAALGLPTVAAHAPDQLETTCSGVALGVTGLGDALGCTVGTPDDPLYFHCNDPRDPIDSNVLGLSEFPPQPPFTGRIEVTIEDPDTGQSAKAWQEAVAGQVISHKPFDKYPGDGVTVTVEILPFNGSPPTGHWRVIVQHSDHFDDSAC